MSNDFWVLLITVGVAVILLGVLSWFQYQTLAELRKEGERNSGFRSQLLGVLDEVKTTFLKADGSFKHLIDTLEGVGNLQQIKERVNQISANLVDEHQKIESQIGVSARIIDQLHQLVTHWSKEGSELQQAYHALAEAIREEILREAGQREKLSIQLETLIQRMATGKPADVAK
jgi:uncharacterized phage infection (PIP) family protein YhgE